MSLWHLWRTLHLTTDWTVETRVCHCLSGSSLYWKNLWRNGLRWWNYYHWKIEMLPGDILLSYNYYILQDDHQKQADLHFQQLFCWHTFENTVRTIAVLFYNQSLSILLSHLKQHSSFLSVLCALFFRVIDARSRGYPVTGIQFVIRDTQKDGARRCILGRLYGSLTANNFLRK